MTFLAYLELINNLEPIINSTYNLKYKLGDELKNETIFYINLLKAKEILHSYKKLLTNYDKTQAQYELVLNVLEKEFKLHQIHHSDKS